MPFVMAIVQSNDAADVLLWAIEGREPPKIYLRSYTPDGHGGRGRIETTEHVAFAKRFDDVKAVLDEWKRPSATHPTRRDGRPNRPLSAFTIEPTEVK